MRRGERKQSNNDILLALLEKTAESVSSPLKKNDEKWGHKVDWSTSYDRLVKMDKSHVMVSLTYKGEPRIILYAMSIHGVTLTHILSCAVLYFSNAGAFYAYKAKLDELKKKTELVTETVNEHN